MTTLTKNKITRISKISAIFKFHNTFRAVLAALWNEAKITASMTAKQIAQIIDARYSADAMKKVDDELKAGDDELKASEVSTYTLTSWTRKGKAPWTAVVIGKCPQYGVKRDFVAAMKKGDKHEWTLESGKIYEAFEQVSNARESREFFRILNGKRALMTKQDVIASFA